MSIQQYAKKKVIIIGAGPAGLTAAYELCKDNDNYDVILIEADEQVGGISKTIVYKNFRIDIGGHRFFSKSEKVLQWWTNILPIAVDENKNIDLSYKGQNHYFDLQKYKTTSTSTEDAMLIRTRSSHILFHGKLFNYPLKINQHTLKLLGIKKSLKIGFSFLKSKVGITKKETNLEEFLINRFGNHLYKTFFKSYTEKVWGKPCNEISAEWGAQRIKGLDIFEVIVDYVKKKFVKHKSIHQKNTQTSLIEYFLYPKKGPGQLWEKVQSIIESKNVKIEFNTVLDTINHENNQIKTITIKNKAGEVSSLDCDYLISTIPVKHLFRAFTNPVPTTVLTLANSLEYRDFITVGISTSKLFNYTLQDIPTKDNWIYIQEDFVQVGRMQIFNHWSDAMADDQQNFWIGLEYFCYKTDAIWQLSDEEMIALAKKELKQLHICYEEDIFDAVVVRIPKAYPAYWGAYSAFDSIKNYADSIENLFLIGRNGMHKYNNQDHSMLTAIEAVKNIQNNITTKNNIWSINTEMEYLESSK